MYKYINSFLNIKINIINCGNTKTFILFQTINVYIKITLFPLKVNRVYKIERGLP